MNISKTTKIFLVILLVAILLRVTFVTIDPPAWSTQDLGLFADEGYKTLSAKNLVLFGETHPHPEDSYPGWSRLSPVSHALFLLVFELFGTGYLQARLINILFSIASIILTFFIVKKISSDRAALIATGFLSINISYLIYNKIALLETPLTFFLLLSCYFFLLAKDKPFWLLGSCISFILAFLIKPLAILFLPALLYMIYDIFSHRISKKLILVSLLSMIGIFFVTILVFPQIIDIIINFAQARHPGSLRMFFVLAYRFWYADFFVLNTMLLLFFIIYTIRFIPRLLEKKTTSYENLFFIWILGGMGLLLIQSYRPARYFVTIIPVLCIISGLVLSSIEKIHKKMLVKILSGMAGVIFSLHLYYFFSLFNISLTAYAFTFLTLLFFSVFWIPKIKLTRLFQNALIIVYLFVNFLLIAYWFLFPSFTLVDSSSSISDYISEDEVLLGVNWAPALCLETNIVCYHVSGDFNENISVFEEFDVDYFVIDKFEILYENDVPFYNEQFNNSLTFVKEFTVGNFNMTLYKFDKETYYR